MTIIIIFSPAVHSIENELEDNTQIQAVVRTSLALCSSIYTMTSLFGFLLFGDATLDDVLSNFDSNLGIPYGSLLNDAVRISYAAHLMLVFPIVFYPLRLSLDGLLFPSSRRLTSDNLRFTLITIGLISIIFLGANFIPSIWDAFQFTGATAAVCIGFIFPAAITLRFAKIIVSKLFSLLHVNAPVSIYSLITQEFLCAPLQWLLVPMFNYERFCFSLLCIFRDRYGISTKRDRILCIFMIVLAVFSNIVAIYSDAYALFKKNASPRAWSFLLLTEYLESQGCHSSIKHEDWVMQCHIHEIQTPWHGWCNVLIKTLLLKV